MLAAGTLLGPYRIVAPLGAGGMGEVYRARDLRLDRDVAVKVLPAEYARDPQRVRRFEQEARAAGALDHPNVVVIHDIGTCEGAPYVVMELLDGATLRELVARGPVPPRRAIEYVAQAARGLAAAHGHGVVHRDLKPENLFLTRDGRVKVLDFGLAKLSRPQGPVPAGEDPNALTASMPGTMLGTVGYMAPEQVRGEEADSRADLFALGAILHELTTGRQAFRGATPVEALYAILNREPEPLPSVTAGVPAGLDSVVRRCLEKRPEERFQSAQDLAYALEGLGSAETPRAAIRARRPPRWAVLAGAGVLAIVTAAAVFFGLRGRAVSGTVPLDPNRIVVAVFENQTGDGALDPLGRMASDWITQGVSRIEGLEAVPSTSVLFVQPGAAPRGRGVQDPVHLLAEQTRAGTVVSGAYYLAGDSLRFQARISDAVHGRLLQALDPVSGPRGTPLAAIHGLRERVMGGLAASLEAIHNLGTQQRPPLYEAYREFIAGFELFETDNPAALRHFEAATRLDPDFLPPLFYEAYILHGLGQDARVEEIMRTLTERRHELPPFGGYWLGTFTAYWAHRYAEALHHVRGAERTAPRDPMTTLWVGMLARYANRPRENVEVYTRFGPRPYPDHPVGGWWMMHLCSSLHVLGEHRRELNEARAARRAHPTQEQLWLCEGAALAALGRTGEASRLVDDCLLAPPMPRTPGLLMLWVAAELRVHGHRAASLSVAARAAEWYRARLEAEPGGQEWLVGLLDALRWRERWDEAAPVADTLARRWPDDPAWRGILGSLAARRGDRAAAGRYAEELQRMDTPRSYGEAAWRRAGIAAQLGDKARAVELLRRAFAEGLILGIDRHREIDLEPLWSYAPYRELMRPRG